MRIGIGYDIHPFQKGRALVLGGVHFPGQTGLGGHSDADVILHAIIDALFGAAGLSDIGQHFPPDDPAYQNADSVELLTRAGEILLDDGLVVESLDATVIAERPKISPHTVEMRARIAGALLVPPTKVNVKATTNERIGFIGRSEGIAAIAVALLTESL
jgi:2-C-methyl-D-erythritol 2,4-cyclodiphosphate synthase